jgi:hypothetical protein
LRVFVLATKPCVRSPPGSRKARVKADTALVSAASNLTPFQLLIEAALEINVPAASKAKVSPESPELATDRMRVNSASGLMINARAPRVSPVASLIGAATCITAKSRGGRRLAARGEQRLFVFVRAGPKRLRRRALLKAGTIAAATRKLRRFQLERCDDDGLAVGEKFGVLGLQFFQHGIALPAAAAADVGDDRQVAADQLHHAVAERAHPFLQAFARDEFAG